MKGKVVRVCHLEVYDIFLRLGVEYKVIRNEHGRMYYTTVSAKQTNFIQDMGANSQEWVLLVAKARPSKKILNSKRLIIKRDLAGNYIDDFHSLQKAAKSVGVIPNAIRNALNGESKSSGGYRWEYAD